MDQKFTLIIPTYNEASIIQQTLSTLVTHFNQHLTVPWYIVVADNASTDGTGNLVRAFEDSRVSLLSLNEKGKGRAIRAGFQAAHGGIVAFVDADLSVDLSDIVSGLGLILRGEHEIVNGSRFLSKSDTSTRPWHRRFISYMYRKCAMMFTGLQVTDAQCPLKIMNERCTPIMLGTIHPTWWSELEFFWLVQKLGVVVKEIPVTWHEYRYSGQRRSNIKIIRDSGSALMLMLRINKRLQPILRQLQDRMCVRPTSSTLEY